MSDIIRVIMYGEVQMTGGESMMHFIISYPRICLEMTEENHDGLSVNKAAVFKSQIVYHLNSCLK